MKKICFLLLPFILFFTLAVSVIAGTKITVTLDSNSRIIRINNKSSLPIIQVSVSRVNTEKYDSVSGKGEVILPNSEAFINLDDGVGTCRFDIKATWSNGKYLVLKNAHICAGIDWKIVDAKNK